jgi:hypothetical protein
LNTRRWVKSAMNYASVKTGYFEPQVKTLLNFLFN